MYKILRKIFKSGIIKNQQAQAMVEFMFVFPVVLVLVLGCIEFSFLSLIHQNVNFASFSAARAETVGRTGRLSAVLKLYTFCPHTIQSLPPSLAFQALMEDLYKQYTGDFTEWLEDMLKDYIGSKCIFEIFDLIGEQVDGDGYSTESQALQGLSWILSKFFTGTDYLLNATIETMENSVNPVMDEEFMKLPVFLRKLIYGFLLTEVEVEEDNTTYPNAPTIKVNITYYYHLKFPVIRNIFAFTLKGLRQKGKDPFHDTGDKWYRANLLSEKSNSIFIPISHSYIIGNEKKMAG